MRVSKNEDGDSSLCLKASARPGEVEAGAGRSDEHHS